MSVEETEDNNGEEEGSDKEDEDDNDEETRIHSFQKLVQYIEQGNRCLNGNRDGMNLFLPSSNDDDIDDEGEEEPWMDETRVQALYTLVRYVI